MLWKTVLKKPIALIALEKKYRAKEKKEKKDKEKETIAGEKRGHRSRERKEKSIG